MNIPQSNLDELMKDPKAAALLKDQALLQRVLQSPDTKRLMETLSQKFGDQLQHTAQSAVHGDRRPCLAWPSKSWGARRAPGCSSSSISRPGRKNSAGSPAAQRRGASVWQNLRKS